MEPRQGTALVKVCNGGVSTVMNLEIISLPDNRDMVIGLPDFNTFGIELRGVPSKTPGQVKEAGDDHYKSEDEKPAVTV